MSELKTTGLFVGAAALSLGLAWAFRPTAVLTESQLADEKRGSVIFADLDPNSATSFRISKFNEELASLSRIELSKDTKTDLWTLPSADGYPADSAEQVSRAITPLVDLTVLSTVSTDRGDHATFGVVEPNEEELTVSASGVGLHVQVGGSEDRVLASLIIGKKVEDRENQHYVRVPTEDAVYVVEIDKDVFSTDLAKWIKGEILNIRGFDIETVGLRDYAILPTERGYGLARNFDADLSFQDNQWNLVRFVDHAQENASPTDQIPEGQSLDESALNDLRNSVQNLKIVNVRRKPLGLAADLKVDKSFEDNRESIKSLQDQGFFAQQGEMFAAAGELIVGTKDGVNYLLRFGNTKVSSAATLQTGSESTEEDDEDEGEAGVTRYLLITAQLDESKFPPPELKMVPETIEEMLALEAAEKGSEVEGVESTEEAAEIAEEENNEEVPSDNPPTSTEPASDDSEAPGEPPADDATPETENADNETDGPAPEESSRRNSRDETQPDRVALTRLVATSSLNQEQSAEESASETNDQATPTDPSDDLSVEKEDPTELSPSRQETQEELKERLEYLQETLRKENQRLLDTRNEKLAEAQKKVAELNARFADWYYMVSDSVYNKLKVNRDKLFQDANAVGDNLPTQPGSFQLPTE